MRTPSSGWDMNNRCITFTYVHWSVWSPWENETCCRRHSYAQLSPVEHECSPSSATRQRHHDTTHTDTQDIGLYKVLHVYTLQPMVVHCCLSALFTIKYVHRIHMSWKLQAQCNVTYLSQQQPEYYFGQGRINHSGAPYQLKAEGGGPFLIRVARIFRGCFSRCALFFPQIVDDLFSRHV